MEELATTARQSLSKAPNLASVEIAASRSAQEVQAAMIIAKKFPRDVIEAEQRIVESCKRPRLAEQAQYSYPRGGTQVMGPSIRLAEAMAQAWGNLDFGIIELEQRQGESTIMAFAWDLETNARQQKVFTVKHQRKARGQINTLDDPRDIYEMVANQGARRLRACILGIIPGDIQDAALEQCNKTLTGQSDVPLKQRLKAMCEAFSSEFGVSTKMLKSFLGHNLEATTENDLIRLRGIYKSLQDGMSRVDQWFKPDTPQVTDGPTPFDGPPAETSKPPAEQPKKSSPKCFDCAKEGTKLYREDGHLRCLSCVAKLRENQESQEAEQTQDANATDEPTDELPPGFPNEQQADPNQQMQCDACHALFPRDVMLPHPQTQEPCCPKCSSENVSPVSGAVGGL